MKAIILSAGQGSRLGHLIDDRPKCLIDFNGRTLLDRQLDTLAANGVDEAVVVTGFHDEQVEAAIAGAAGGPKVRTVFNPFYKVADNTGSLFMAREELAGDCLVWNGDTLVSRRADGAGASATTAPGICVTIDRKDGYDDDDMKVVDDGEGGCTRSASGSRAASTPSRSACWRSAAAAPSASARRSSSAMRTAEGTTIWYLRVIHHLAQKRRRVDARHHRRGMGRSRLPRRRRASARADGALGRGGEAAAA